MNIDELDAKDIGNAAKKVAQKVGTGARAIGQKIGAKGSGSMMGKAMDKVAKGEALPANLAKQIAPFAKQLETILSDQALRQKFMMVVKQAERYRKLMLVLELPLKLLVLLGKLLVPLQNLLLELPVLLLKLLEASEAQ